MAGIFTTKRRKQDSRRPQAQASSHRSSLHIGRSSPHTASKPGHVHITDVAALPQLRLARAQEWSIATGKALPPSLRIREPLGRDPRKHSGPRWRWACYTRAARSRLDPATQDAISGTLYQVPAEHVLDDPRLTPAQARRLRHKAGTHGERPAGWVPARARHARARAEHARYRRAGGALGFADWAQAQ